MAESLVFPYDRNAPSVRERIKALFDHREQFQMIAEYPQANIYQRFSKEWALALAYVEGKVYRCGRAAESFLRENAHPGRVDEDDDELGSDFTEVMEALIDALLLDGRTVKASQRIVTAYSPSKVFMRKYRDHIQTGNGSGRAANGERASIYRNNGDPVPFNLAAADDVDLEPMAQFIADRLMNPVVDYLCVPLLRFWRSLRLCPPKRPAVDDDLDAVNVDTISTIAKALVWLLATLVLVAPIATFNIVEDQTLRIMATPLFCLLFAASAQVMGSRSIPMFTLVAT